MIIEFIMQAAYNVATWFIGLFPVWEPNQVANAAGQVQGLAQVVGGMSPWVNWLALAGQVVFVLGLYFAFLSLRILRALIGHVPLVGGNG